MGGKSDELYATEGSGGFVDVRDVAEAHVRAATVAEAGGKRFIISSSMCIFNLINIDH